MPPFTTKVRLSPRLLQALVGGVYSNILGENLIFGIDRLSQTV
jgi:hypothetical protein